MHDVNVVALVLKERRLPGNHLKIGIDPTFVACVEEVERLLRRGCGVALLARFDLQIMQRVQVVLNLLKCGERGLPVKGDGGIVLIYGNVGNRSAATMIEERLRHSRTDGEEAARP